MTVQWSGDYTEAAWFTAGALRYIERPANAQTGDLLLFVLTTSGAPLSIPAGFTILGLMTDDPVVAYRIVTDDEPLAYSWDDTGAIFWAAFMSRFTSTVGNAVTVDDWDSDSGGPGLTYDFPALTASTDEDLFVLVQSTAPFLYRPDIAKYTVFPYWDIDTIATGTRKLFQHNWALSASGSTGTIQVDLIGTTSPQSYYAKGLLLKDTDSPAVVIPPEVKPEIKLGLGGAFSEETENFVSASGVHRIAPPEDSIVSSRGIVSQANITFSNKDGRYSPLNTSSPIYSDIMDGKIYQAPVEINVSLDGGASYARVFTGIAKIPTETVVTASNHPMLDIDCRGNEDKILNSRTSTTLTNFAAYHDDGADEGEIITAWMVAAGLGTADYNIDSGMFTIPWAWLDDESPVEDAWQLAAACGGRFRADVGGTLVYERMDKWLYGRGATPLYTFTHGDYAGLEIWYNDQELYNGVTVEASARDVDVLQVVWEPDEQVLIPAGGTVTLTAHFQQPVYTYGSVSYTPVTTGNASLAGDVTVTATVYAQHADLVITNGNATSGAILKGFNITGQPVSSTRAQEASADSAESFWDDRGARERTIRGNVYIQSHAQAATLADFLIDRYETPRLFFRMTNCPGRPNLRLGDRITISNPVAMSTAEDAYVTAIAWRLSYQGYYQDIEAIAADGLFPYAGSYFILDVDTLGTPTPTDKVFY